jgi:hypothetical protein
MSHRTDMNKHETIPPKETLNPHRIAAHLFSHAEKQIPVERTDPETGTVIYEQNWDILLYSEKTRRTTKIKVYPNENKIGISMKRDSEFINSLPEPIMDTEQADSLFDVAGTFSEINDVRFLTAADKSTRVRFMRHIFDREESVTVYMKGAVTFDL